MSRQTCTTRRRMAYTCGEPAKYSYEAACRHEHPRTGFHCADCHDHLTSRRYICLNCYDFDGHRCALTFLSSTPLVGESIDA